eukprot:c20371_g1_i2 orf=280-663(-)
MSPSPMAQAMFLSSSSRSSLTMPSLPLAGLPLLQAMTYPAPRSGLAWKHSIDVGAGVIDADYRGPVGVVLFNLSDQDFAIKSGDRVAQLILERIVTPEVLEVDDLEETGRGEGGFGSTGIATVARTS